MFENTGKLWLNTRNMNYTANNQLQLEKGHHYMGINVYNKTNKSSKQLN